MWKRVVRERVRLRGEARDAWWKEEACVARPPYMYAARPFCWRASESIFQTGKNAESMELNQLLEEDLVRVKMTATCKEAVIETLCELLIDKGYVKEDYAQAVLAREVVFPTGLPTEGIKVALPHTDTEYVNRTSIAIATLKDPVEFHVMGSPDETVMVNIVFLLAIKEKEEVVNMLSRLATTFQDGALLQAVFDATSPGEILAALLGGGSHA